MPSVSSGGTLQNGEVWWNYDFDEQTMENICNYGADQVLRRFRNFVIKVIKRKFKSIKANTEYELRDVDAILAATLDSLDVTFSISVVDYQMMKRAMDQGRNAASKQPPTAEEVAKAIEIYNFDSNMKQVFSKFLSCYNKFL